MYTEHHFDIRWRNVAWSILVAIAIVFCLGIMLAMMVVVFHGPDENDGQSTGCIFTSSADQITLYDAPISAPSRQYTMLPGGEVAYPIVEQNRGYYLLQPADDLAGWVDSRTGVVDGDCDEIPVDETSLAEFPSVCAFITANDTVLYAESDLLTPLATLLPGAYLIEAIDGDRYYMVLDDGTGGWVLSLGGELSGNCDQF